MSEIQVTDRELIELADKIMGTRTAIEVLSESLGRTTRIFWQKAREKYKLDANKNYVLKHDRMVIIEAGEK